MSAPGLRASTKSLPRVARPEADLKGARRPTNRLPARISLKIVIILSGPTTTAWSSKMRLSGPPGQITARLCALWQLFLLLLARSWTHQTLKRTPKRRRPDPYPPRVDRLRPGRLGSLRGICRAVTFFANRCRPPLVLPRVMTTSRCGRAGRGLLLDAVRFVGGSAELFDEPRITRQVKDINECQVWRSALRGDPPALQYCRGSLPEVGAGPPRRCA